MFKYIEKSHNGDDIVFSRNFNSTIVLVIISRSYTYLVQIIVAVELHQESAIFCHSHVEIQLLVAAGGAEEKTASSTEPEAQGQLQSCSRECIKPSRELRVASIAIIIA